MDVKQPTDRFDETEKEVIEIRLSDIGAFLKRSSRAILIGALIGTVLGSIYAFLQSNQYNSQITVMPEVQSKGNGNLGNLGSLAGLAGINIDGLTNTSEVIRPDLYSTVVQSVPFALYMLNEPVNSREFGKTQPLKAYLRAHREKSIAGQLSQMLLPTSETLTENVPAIFDKSIDIIQLSKPQEEEISSLLQQIVVAYDKKTGIITIDATMPDPVVAATVARYTLTYLANYVTSYRTEKASKEVNFLNQLVNVARKRYQTAEYSLSVYRDRNRNLFTNTAKIEEQRIQAEFLLAQDLYNSLTKQLELSKIKVQEQTPVFKVLNPPQVPLRKSKPKRALIVCVTAIVGLLTGLGFMFIRNFFNKK